MKYWSGYDETETGCLRAGWRIPQLSRPPNPENIKRSEIGYKNLPKKRINVINNVYIQL